MTRESAPQRSVWGNPETATSLLRNVTFVVVTLLLLALGGWLQAALGTTALSSEQFEHRTQYWVNQARIAETVPRLTRGTCVDRAASDRAAYLASKGEFYHLDLTPVLDDCNAVLVGEVLLQGSVRPKRAVELWLDSPGHNEVMLRTDYRKIGVDAVRLDDGRWLVSAVLLRH